MIIKKNCKCAKIYKQQKKKKEFLIGKQNNEVIRNETKIFNKF